MSCLDKKNKAGTIILDKEKMVLLYQKLKSYLEEEIRTSKPGQRLPSENEICKRFGVSRITVQRALRDLREVAPIIRKKGKGTFVLPVLNHKSIETKTVKMVFPFGYNPEDDFLFPITKALIKEFMGSRLNLMISPLKNHKKIQEDFSNLAGVFWIAPFKSHYKTIEEIVLRGIPVIVINRVIENPDINYVSTDHYSGALIGTRLLLTHHDRIGFVGLIRNNTCLTHHYEGYCFALEEAGKKVQKGLIVHAMVDRKLQLIESHLEDGLNKMFSEFKPDALLVAGEIFIEVVIKFLQKKKIVPGKDIDIVCLGDFPAETPYYENITRIIQPLEKIGSIAASKMKELLEGRVKKVRVSLMPFVKKGK